MNGKTGIFFGSSTGNTEAAAESLATALGIAAEHVHNVDEASAADVLRYDFLVLGSPTWGFGDLQDDWEGFVSVLEQLDLKGRKAAIFGLGDQETYPDTFVDAMAAIYLAVRGAGAEVVGRCPADGYDHSSSRAEDGGVFVGLPLDFDNQEELTAGRIADWAGRLKHDFS